MNRQMEEYAKKKTAGIKSASAYQNTAASSSKEEEVQTHVNKDLNLAVLRDMHTCFLERKIKNRRNLRWKSGKSFLQNSR